MAKSQTKLGSLIEANANTLASLGVFMGFGLPWEFVAGLTLSMLIKNLVIRRVFLTITRRWGL